MNKIDLTKAQFNAFNSIGNNWMIIGACDGERKNAMTASWGAVGVMWGKNVFYCHIRPQRYTYTIVENTDILTLSVFDGAYKKQLSYFGSVSGKDEDKLANGGLNYICDDKKLFFPDAKYIFIGKKIYAFDISPECIIDPAITSHYTRSDYHRTYICEILEAFEK
ncbi:MAG: flavin reductase family protein [Oscillospiraceae bacterium]|nr:flavin reductase family protein [Oscillospiraceae bacterium]